MNVSVGSSDTRITNGGIDLFGMYADPMNDESEIIIIRTGMKKIGITTREPLSDEQVQDLYWIVMAMSKTGKRLGELFKKE